LQLGEVDLLALHALVFVVGVGTARAGGRRGIGDRGCRAVAREGRAGRARGSGLGPDRRGRRSGKGLLIAGGTLLRLGRGGGVDDRRLGRRRFRLGGGGPVLRRLGGGGG